MPSRKDPRIVPTNNDAELARSLLMGCGIVFVLFLCGWAVIVLVWLW